MSAPSVSPATMYFCARIGVKDDAIHLGGMNIFGRGYGNYDSDVSMRLHFR